MDRIQAELRALVVRGVSDPRHQADLLNHKRIRTATGRVWDADRVDTEIRPVYLSKSRLALGVSRLRNEDALCAALARRGVDIAFPETLGLPALVRLLSERRIVLVTTGSAFHTAAFAAPGRRIVGLNWAPHLNANFPLLDGLNGTRGRYYHPAGSEAGPDDGFHFGWSVPDPEGVAEELVRRAAEAGWDLTAVEEPDLIHVYGLLPGVPEARRAFAQVRDFVR